jgi:hypothetical protein
VPSANENYRGDRKEKRGERKTEGTEGRRAHGRTWEKERGGEE